MPRKLQKQRNVREKLLTINNETRNMRADQQGEPVQQIAHTTAFSSLQTGTPKSWHMRFSNAYRPVIGGALVVAACAEAARAWALGPRLVVSLAVAIVGIALSAALYWYCYDHPDHDHQ